MLRHLALLVFFIAILPSAVGAEAIAPLVQAAATTGPAPQQPAAEPRLVASIASQAAQMAVNAPQDTSLTEAAPKEPGSCGGLKNWIDIHWGGYRWIYWAGAALALVALHVAVAD